MVDKIDDEITNVVIPTYYLLSMYFVDIMELIKTELERLIKTESIINQSYDKMIDYEESESEKDNQ
jgi:DNA polymerase II large subunit